MTAKGYGAALLTIVIRFCKRSFGDGLRVTALGLGEVVAAFGRRILADQVGHELWI